MNNGNAKSQLELCDEELRQIGFLIGMTGSTGTLVKYLTKYTLIRACGAIEFSYKTIIADYDQDSHNDQIRNFLQSRVREGSSNPSLRNIIQTLQSFDDNWKKSFKNKLAAHEDSARIRSSIQSLVTLRNEFAHGGSPSASFQSIAGYYADGKALIAILDSVVSMSVDTVESASEVRGG